MKQKWNKKGFVFKFDDTLSCDWWNSHTMAPTAVQLESGRIRIYFGAWDKDKVSSINYIDVCSENPNKVLNISQTPVLSKGADGMFDENGVFPGHAYKYGDKVYLYYTGFQLGHKIRHYNFGGLAISKSGGAFERVSEAPILDRTDEGLYVRAGQSVIADQDGTFHNVYSAGSGWCEVAGEKRPVYDVYYQKNHDGISMASKGDKIVSCDFEVEHGLGRPQITMIDDYYYVFFTRRTLDFKYFIGCAKSKDLKNWSRADNEFDFTHSEEGFDSEMIYFPSVVYAEDVDKYYLFYSGNYFGRDGIGYAVLERYES